MSRGGKVQVTSKAREKLGWKPGEILVEMLNEDEDALVLMREGDVSVEKRESKEKTEKMTQKYLRVTMPDGSKWDVPALLIVQHRAREIVKIDSQTSFDKEVEYALSDEYEITDWAANNMNWKDVVLQAQIVSEDREIDYQEGWINGDQEIIEK